MGFKDWWKKNKNRDVRDATSENFPTFQRWGRNVGAGAAMAGGMMADGMKRTAKGLLQLVGHGTWLFVILAAIGHALLVFTPSPPISFVGFREFFLSVLSSFASGYFIYYLLLALLAAIFFYRDGSDPFPVRTFGKFLLLTIVAFLIPLMLKSYITGGGAMQAVLKICLILSPLWLYFVFADPGDSLTRFVAGAWYLLFCVLIIINILMVLQTNGYVARPGDTVSFVDAWAFVKNGFKAGEQQATNSIDAFRNGWNRQLNDTVRDYYAGTVDQSRGAPLGVFVERPQSDYLKFYVSDGDDVSASAILKARSLADEPLTISNDCHIEILDERDLKNITSVNVSGRVVPANSNFVYTAALQDQQDLQCVIANDELKKYLIKDRLYTGTVVFESTFNFTTLSYMHYAFMDRDLYVAMRQANLNPAIEMGVKENPVAVYTPGPVMIGMARDTQPFTYVSDKNTPNYNTQLPAFGLTFSSATFGKGRLVSFEDLHLYIPKQFELNREECIPGSLKTKLKPYVPSGGTGTTSPQPWSENDMYWDYVITDVQPAADLNYFSMRCPLVNNDIGGGAAMPVLTPAGASLYTFYAQANYTYVAVARTEVVMQGSSTFATQSSSTDSATGASCQNIPGKSCPDENNRCWCAYYDSSNNPYRTCYWANGQEDIKTCANN